MKIEHEIQDVEIVRYRTIADALTAGLGKHLLDGPSNRILNALHLDRPTEVSLKLSETLREPLRKWYESGEAYRRTLALVSLDGEMTAHDFRRKLAEDGYYPASVSEGMSYIRLLTARRIEVDGVLHLGTFLRTETFEEKRLLTRKNGDIELIAFHSAMKLKSYYRIIAVKEEKKQVKK